MTERPQVRIPAVAGIAAQVAERSPGGDLLAEHVDHQMSYMAG